MCKIVIAITDRMSLSLFWSLHFIPSSYFTEWSLCFVAETNKWHGIVDPSDYPCHFRLSLQIFNCVISIHKISERLLGPSHGFLPKTQWKLNPMASIPDLSSCRSCRAFSNKTKAPQSEMVCKRNGPCKLTIACLIYPSFHSPNV